MSVQETSPVIVNDDFSEIQVNPADIGRIPLAIPGLEHAAWRVSEPMQPMGDPRVFATYLNEHVKHQAGMVTTLVTAASDQNPNTHGLGGKKVRSNKVWNQQAFRLLSVRAMLMFCKANNVEAAHLTDRWGNALETTDYSAAHSHYESSGSVVYFVDLGESHPEHPLSGAFELMDPRIEFCCSRGPDRPTRGLMPKLQAGVMLLFPSQWLHSVHPYYGTRPRLTLAWNINAGRRPADMNHSMEDQVQGAIGIVKGG